MEEDETCLAMSTDESALRLRFLVRRGRIVLRLTSMRSSSDSSEMEKWDDVVGGARREEAGEEKRGGGNK